MPYFPTKIILNNGGQAVHEWVYVGAIVKSSVYLQLDTTLGDDVFIVLRRDDVCMKEQSCPGHGLWEQCDHGPAGGVGRGGIVLNLPAARNRQTALV